MIIGTMKESVMFGKKATQRIETRSESTSYSIERDYSTSLIMIKGNSSAFKSNYQKVDFSEQKKMRVCRRLNKLMSGY